MVEENEENQTTYEEENLSQEVDELLEEGFSQKEIEARGYSPSLVRQRIRKMVKAGKAPSSSSAKDSTLAIRKEKESVIPEWLAPEIAEIFDGNIRDQKLFIAGISIPLLGLRLFGEAVNPISNLFTVWLKSQVEVTKSIQGNSTETAQAAVQQFLAQSMPQILHEVRSNAVAASPDPMAAMMTRIMEPILQNMMTSFTSKMMNPGMGMMPPGQVPPGQPFAPQSGVAFGPGTQPVQGKQVSKEEFEEAFNDD